MPEFVPGIELARGFYEEVLAPALHGVAHSAARLGRGSDVLGLDDERSTDHGWGPRAQIFVRRSDARETEQRIEGALPDTYHGWPVRFGWDEVPVRHHVEVAPLGAWLEEQLGLDPRGALSVVDWLVLPQQRLLEVTAGAVFHDGLGELDPVRAQLAWYPRDVWLWLLACAWHRIAQEEAFVGRATEVGDVLGARVVAGRLVRELMRLAFLLERRYAPYSKWLGSAFERLEAAPVLAAPLRAALDADEDAFVAAYEELARRQNALGLAHEVDSTARRFHARPFRVIGGDRLAHTCRAAINDPWLRSLPLVGSIDQAVDSTDVLAYPRYARGLRILYVPDDRTPLP